LRTDIQKIINRFGGGPVQYRGPPDNGERVSASRKRNTTGRAPSGAGVGFQREARKGRE
jgi:hypothetical protein